MLTPIRVGCVALSCLLLGIDAVNVRSQDVSEVPTSLYVLDLAGNGIALTSARDGVDFDIDGTGRRIRVGWTTAGSDDAFLALDINRNGSIDSATELVSTRARLPDGKVVTSANEVLRVLQGLGPPVPGTRLPPGSATFDPDDAAFASVLVWVDDNHDGRSRASELRTLGAAHIRSIAGGFRRSRDIDANGNQTILNGTFRLEQRGVDFQRPLIIVRLAR
jgi:hypothetical protein